MADPTTGELFKAKTVTDDEVAAAVDVFMRDPTVSMFRFTSGHTLDPAAAVKAYEPTRNAVANPDWTEKYRRGMVRTAILLARPTAPSVSGRSTAACPNGSRCDDAPVRSAPLRSPGTDARFSVGDPFEQSHLEFK